MVQPLKQGEECYSLEMIRSPSTLGQSQGAWPPPPSNGLWKSFRFTKVNVMALKAQAEQLCSTESDVSPFVLVNPADEGSISGRV